MTSSDPRLLLYRSFDQASQVVGRVTPDQIALLTPCDEFDVADLLRHLAGVANRIAGIGRGVAQTGVLPVPEGIPVDGWAAAFDAAKAEATASWADDGVLERKIELPFGTFNGATVAQIYTLELTTHTWDLASATGQVAMLDDELAEASLPIAQGMLPPEQRGGFIPFGAVVPVAADAPAYHQLAGFLGRSVG